MNDEAVRRGPNTEANHNGSARGGLEMTPLGRAEALALLGSVGFGRIVFTRNALPAIRPVNHALIDGDLIIRIPEGAALTRAAGGSGVVVAYEADMIDPDTHEGWSVVVTGYARLVTDPIALERYEAALTPWVNEHMQYAVLIGLDDVTGFRLTIPRDHDETDAQTSPPV
jgi:hypothetical protein